MAVSKSTQNIIVGLAVGGVVLYVAYKLIFARKVSAAGSPYALSGGGAGGYYPNPYYTQSSSSGSSLLDSILKALGAQKKGSNPGAGLGAGSGAASSASRGSSINPLQTLADFVNAGNQSLWSNYDPSMADYSSPTLDSSISGGYFQDAPMQSLDLSNLAQTYYPYADANTGADYSGAYTDFAAGGGGFDPSIPYDVIEGGSGIGDIPDYYTN